MGLPEVSIEASTAEYDTEGGHDVPDAPALADLLAVVASEGDGLHLSLRRSRCEERHNHHQQYDEDEQPALEDEPVGLPEPGGGIPYRS